MTTKHTDVGRCPSPNCEQTADVSFATTEPRTFNIESFEQERICVVPGTLEGKPAVQVIYHKEIKEIEESDEDVADPGDLEGESLIVFDKTVEAAAGDGEVGLSALKGKCVGASIPPDEVEEIVDELTERGYLDEVGSGKFRPRA